MTAPLVIVVDIPWRFVDSLPGNGRGASRHYDTPSTGSSFEICRAALDPSGMDNAVLFFWRVAAMQAEALDIVHDLGFTVKSELVWYKQTRTGKPHFGMGHYVRASHEVCLIATRGSGVLPATRSQRSVFMAPVGVHSEKPGAFYRIVEEMYPHSRRIELFARTVRPGWEQHGNELGKLGGSA